MLGRVNVIESVVQEMPEFFFNIWLTKIKILIMVNIIHLEYKSKFCLYVFRRIFQNISAKNEKVLKISCIFPDKWLERRKLKKRKL